MPTTKTPVTEEQPKAPAAVAPAPAAPFEFPKDAAESLKEANQTYIGLPFETYVWYTKNGRPAAQKTGGVDFTGGLASSSFVESAFQVVDIDGTTHDFTKEMEPLLVSNLNQNGEPYETIELQSITIVPIVWRKRWYEGRSHAQVLALQRLPGPNGSWVYCYAIISARGYQSSILLDELGRAANESAQARRDLGGPPSNFFWHRVGMPSKPEFKLVGKAGSQSTITPVMAKIPLENLREEYIGSELATTIGALVGMEEVKLWKDAWKDEKTDSRDGPPTEKHETFEEKSARTAPAQQKSRFDDIPF